MTATAEKTYAFVCNTAAERAIYNYTYSSVASHDASLAQYAWAHEDAQSAVRAYRFEQRDAAQSARNLRCCDSCRAHESHRFALRNMDADCACECEGVGSWHPCSGPLCGGVNASHEDRNCAAQD